MLTVLWVNDNHHVAGRDMCVCVCVGFPVFSFHAGGGMPRAARKTLSASLASKTEERTPAGPLVEDVLAQKAEAAFLARAQRWETALMSSSPSLGVLSSPDVLSKLLQKPFVNQIIYLDVLSSRSSSDEAAFLMEVQIGKLNCVKVPPTLLRDIISSATAK
jgi:hypothetical protein